MTAATVTRSDLLRAAAAGQAAARAGEDFRACPHSPSGGKVERLRAAAWLRAFRRADPGGVTAAALAPDDAPQCTCCGGSGEHTCGHECYSCDAAGTREAQAEASDGLEAGDPIVCEGHHGRPDPCNDGRQGDECEHDPDPVSPDAPPEDTPTVAAAAATAGGFVTVAPPETDTQESLDAEAEALLADGRPAAERAPEARALLDRYAAIEATPPPELVDLAAADAEATGEASTGLTWWGVLAPENLKTGDRRLMRNVTWGEPPFTLLAQFQTAAGHDDAVAVGLVTAVERVGDLITAVGTWDDPVANPAAAEARRQNINGMMRGVSVDMDLGEGATVYYEDADGNVLDFDALMELDMDAEVFEVWDGGRLRASTLCYIPAFVEAYILDDTVADQKPTDSVVNAPATGVGLTAAAMRRPEPVYADAAPSTAFSYPGAERLAYEDGSPRGLTLTDDGHVYGYLATWGTCHVGIAGECVTPPTSETGYAYYLKGEYRTSDGRVVPVGALTMDTGHAPIDLAAAAAAAHYDNTGTASAWVTVGEDETGIWMAGVLDEDLPLPKRRKLQRCGAVSGDWRRLGGNLELIANLAVNVAGFPIPKVQTRVASAAPQALVASGVVHPHELSGDFSRVVSEAVERALTTRELKSRVRRLRAATIKANLDRVRS